MTWHVLDASSIWLKEFCSALSRQAPTICWSPVMKLTGMFENWHRDERLSDPNVVVRHFPLQRGYADWPASTIIQAPASIARMIRRSEKDLNNSPLICTTPYYAPVAERWPGPVVYYQTDLTVKYDGVNPDQVRALDRRLCKIATIVCPNSQRIADYMVNDAQCDPSKISIVPNATREANLYTKCPNGPGELLEDIADLPRPIAGVIGNLAANMDWSFLRGLVDRTPDVSWVFVGPLSMPIRERDQSEAREELVRRASAQANRGYRIRFVGSKPYGDLQAYARSFDVAVLPYMRKEPTFSGSSTRFYEHLAACRPMISTRGFAELLHKEPLLRLVNTAEEAAAFLEDLRCMDFVDGHEHSRWIASRKGTWEERASSVVHALEKVVEPQLVTALR